MSSSRPGFPIGATLAGGGFVIRQRLRGEPARGMYRGVDRHGRPVLVTVGTRQQRPFAELRAALQLEIPGVARLLEIAPVEGGPAGYDGLVEEEPGGEPCSALALPLEVGEAIDLGLGLVEILGRVHAADAALVNLRPELIYHRHGFTGALEVSGVAPRAEMFLRSARPPLFGVPPMFDHLYAAPETWPRGIRSPAGDIFSLCALIAHWVTGQHPFVGRSLHDQMAAMHEGRRHPWRGPAALGALLERGLAPRPGQRPSLDALDAGLLGARPS